MPYNPTVLEEQIQKQWAKAGTFNVKEDMHREKYYCLSMLPYPSGDLHMGHVRNYAIGDAIAHYERMRGKNVLQPMGWDAFGLPAENAAIQRKLPPAEWTEKNIKKMRSQLKRLGLSIDWTREIKTCDPNYYRWEQWLFLKLYEKGLAYQKSAVVNWDPVDNTVLANEQVINGKGWRSGAPVEKREITQWFLKITDYAEELLNDLDQLDGWPEQVRTMQRNWIGKSVGLEIDFPIISSKKKLSVYTTRADTLAGVSFIAIAADHPLAKQAAENSTAIASFIKTCHAGGTAEADLATAEKKGIEISARVRNPLTKAPIPVWITNYVLMDYGTGAVMAVPAHDERDHEFARKYDLPLLPVIESKSWNYNTAAYIGKGKLINSGTFDGLNFKSATKAISQRLIEEGRAQEKVNYRLRDWGISRQRYWGTPIPIVYCQHCGTVPVPKEDLPVTLPTELIPTGQMSPLKTDKLFCQTECPECGKPAQRETDTMDTFVESSWYYARYTCNDQDSAILDQRAKYWAPVDQYIGGIEHAVLHLLYARFFHKVLRDLDLMNSNEPFKKLLTQGMVLKGGVKMSKSKGNTVAPMPLIKKYGADTARLFILFAAPPEQSLEWSDQGVDGCFKFLNKVYIFLETHQDRIKSAPTLSDHDERQAAFRQSLHTLLAQATRDIQRYQFNTVVSSCMKIFNLMSNFTLRIEEDFALLQEASSILLGILRPITPHIAEYWSQALELSEGTPNWPKVDSKALTTSEVELIVQINGKLRGRIKAPTDADEATVKALIAAEENIQKHLASKPLKKCILVKNRLINLVI